MILEPVQRPELTDKTKSAYEQFERLIIEIKKRNFPKKSSWSSIGILHISILSRMPIKNCATKSAKSNPKLLVCWPKNSKSCLKTISKKRGLFWV